MKKLKYLVLLVFVLMPCLLLISACSKPDPNARVMNVSLNPEIEFVLDSENKVVSVNALNDEGNFILAKASFKGLTAEDAVELFIEVSSQNGFVLQGTANLNEVDIEISGENAEKLFNKIKTSVNEALTNANYRIKLELDDIDLEDLRETVEECMQELSESEIRNMTEAELIALIKESRLQTENLLSQELKDFFYQERAIELHKAEMQKIKEQLDSAQGFFASMFSTLSDSVDSLIEKQAELQQKFKDEFLDPESDYQLAIKAFIEDKKALLEARLNNLDEQTIQNLENAVSLAEDALEAAKDAAELAISTLNTAVNNAINTFTATFKIIVNNASQFINISQTEIDNAISTAEAGFKDAFNTLYESYINNNYWTDLTPAPQA